VERTEKYVADEKKGKSEPPASVAGSETVQATSWAASNFSSTFHKPIFDSINAKGSERANQQDLRAGDA
jgi:hypothetical protein